MTGAAHHAALNTPVCELLGIRYPIVQTGMGWVSGVSLTAATAEAGGLGILASATMTLEQLARAVAEMKERTSAPFGVNLRADSPDIDARLDLLVREGVRVASFAQAPGKAVIARLRAEGVACIPTIGARRHAEKVAEWGVDAVICQGAEGGGHTGVVPTSLLLPQVVEAVHRHAEATGTPPIPVIAAGGFHSGAGLVAALAYGAAGIAMGTRFLLTVESRVPQHVKEQYLAAKVTDTVVSTQIDGHPQRVIRTAMVEALERAGLLRFPRAAANALRFRNLADIPLPDMVREGVAMKRNQELSWSQVAMAGNAPMLTKATLVDGNLDAGVLPTGQVAGVIDELPTVSQLIERIMDEADTTLARLTGAAFSAPQEH